MKKALFFVPLLAIAVALTAFIGDDTHEMLAIGTKAPKADLEMKDVSGRMVTLNSLKRDNGLLVVFSCNTCPFVVGNGDGTEGWEGRYNGIAEICAKNNVGMVLVNSNEAKREGVDSFDEMKKHATDRNYMAPYVVDENHVIADAFGAKTTPHIYLFNADMELAYRGAIDDNVKSANKVKEQWLQGALDNMAEGKAIDPAETRQMGCSIKRVK